MYVNHTYMYVNHTLLSDAELKVLNLFLDLNRHYFAEICKKTKLTRPRTLRALRNLVKKSILKTNMEANVKYYYLRRNNFTYSTLSACEYNKTLSFLKKHKTLKRSLDMFNESNKSLISLIYGSYTKGYATKNSDIDLLLIKENFTKNEIKKIEDLIEIINGRTGLKISPHLMKLDEFKENQLSKEAIENHVLLDGAELFFKLVI